MSAVYDIFLRYPPATSRAQYCQTCASDEFVINIEKASQTPRKADEMAFLGLYWESTYCMGGLSNLKFWLPRSLETYILTDVDNGIFTTIGERYQSLGLSAWPIDEQQILRLTFCRALMNFVETGNPKPLGGRLLEHTDNKKTQFLCQADILTIIIGILIYLRIEPKDIFAYLLHNRDERIDFFLGQEISSYFLIMDDNFHFNAETHIDNNDIRSVTEILDRRGRAALFNAVSFQDLINLYEKYEIIGNKILVETLDQALQNYETQNILYNDEAQTKDEVLLFQLLKDVV